MTAGWVSENASYPRDAFGWWNPEPTPVSRFAEHVTWEVGRG